MKANFEKGTKICSKCKKELPIDHFQKDKSKSDGLNTRCKDCVAEYRKSPRGKEVASEARRKYYQTEKGKECQRRSTQKLQKTEHGKEIYKRATKKYRRSEQGIRHELERRKSNVYKEVRLRYIQSEKGKKALKRGNEKYEQSEKGKKVRKYIYMKRILNGRFNEYQNKKYKLDKNYRIGKLLRTRLWSALKNNQKSDHTLDLLGCSIDELKAHLEMQFEPRMTWDNCGKWHIDHIIPCAKFDLSIPENQRICFNYRNLQPMWAKENNTKRDSLPDGWEELLKVIKEDLSIDMVVNLKES
jgi:uncharacterized protein L426